MQDGLWDNGGKIAIHIPAFVRACSRDYRTTSFYVSYDDHVVTELPISHVALDDLVSCYPVWRGLQKATIFFR